MDHAQKTQPLFVAWHRPHRKHMSDCKFIGLLPALGVARMTENTASSIVACCTVFTGLLPGNALVKSITISCTYSTNRWGAFFIITIIVFIMKFNFCGVMENGLKIYSEETTLPMSVIHIIFIFFALDCLSALRS
jgi:hypothetical protein